MAGSCDVSYSLNMVVMVTAPTYTHFMSNYLWKWLFFTNIHKSIYFFMHPD